LFNECFEVWNCSVSFSRFQILNRKTYFVESQFDINIWILEKRRINHFPLSLCDNGIPHKGYTTSNSLCTTWARKYEWFNKLKIVCLTQFRTKDHIWSFVRKYNSKCSENKWPYKFQQLFHVEQHRSLVIMTWIWYTREEKCIGLQSYVDYKGLKCVEICVTFANKLKN
jgi:hypothetical protein